MRPSDRATLAKWLAQMKREACREGRYPEDRREPCDFDERHEWMKPRGFAPFTCVGYQLKVRRIIALERALMEVAALEQEVAMLENDLAEVGERD